MKAALAEARAEARQLLRAKEAQTPWQPLSVVSGVFWPVLLFAYVYWVGSGSLRFYRPPLALALGLVAAAACVAATVQTRTKLRAAAPARALLVVTVCLWTALVGGVLCGDRNYWSYMVSYHTFNDLATYTDIDPSVDKGQSYMDAGQVYFKEGVEVDTKDMVAFRSGSVYCVAPIVGQPLWNQDDPSHTAQSGALRMPTSGTLDFWAVGVDCCDQESKTFTCGAAGSQGARAGIRLLRDDVRPFYRMAVQEWEARMCPLDDNTLKARSRSAPLICPPARHPLFFHWVKDPLMEVDQYLYKSEQLFRLHMLAFLFGDIFLVLALLYALFLLGLR